MAPSSVSASLLMVPSPHRGHRSGRSGRAWICRHCSQRRNR